MKPYSNVGAVNSPLIQHPYSRKRKRHTARPSAIKTSAICWGGLPSEHKSNLALHEANGTWNWLDCAGSLTHQPEGETPPAKCDICLIRYHAGQLFHIISPMILLTELPWESRWWLIDKFWARFHNAVSKGRGIIFNVLNSGGTQWSEFITWTNKVNFPAFVCLCLLPVIVVMN